MNNEEMENQKPPSLDLAFDWVRDVLENQIDDARRLIERETIIFSVATGILGFAIPLALTQSKVTINGYFVASIAAYALLSLITIISLIPINLWDLKNPIIIREEYWDAQESEFKMEILTHMEDAYTHNRKGIVLRSYAILATVSLTFLELVFIALFILFARVA